MFLKCFEKNSVSTCIKDFQNLSFLNLFNVTLLRKQVYESKINLMYSIIRDNYLKIALQYES